MINLIINIKSSIFNKKIDNENISMIYALEHNINNDIIEMIHIFSDNELVINKILKAENKIKLILKKNVDDHDLFQYAETLQDKICMISTNDVSAY